MMNRLNLGCLLDVWEQWGSFSCYAASLSFRKNQAGLVELLFM